MFRFRKNRLTWPAIAVLAFILITGSALIWQLIAFVSEAGNLDWVLLGLLLATILLFIIMGLAVFFLDFDQNLVLARDGIYVMPSIFASYKISWDDIEQLELREGNGFRLIEYRLKPDSPSYQNHIKRDGKRRFLAIEGRNGGFHGAIPVQSYPLDVNTMSEQNNIRANRLFPVLYRFWTNQAARSELPEIELSSK